MLGAIVGIVAYQTMLVPEPVDREPMPVTEGPISPTISVDGMFDWKTYRNEEYGFEFMYPPAIFIKEGDSPIVTISTSNVFDQEEQALVITVTSGVYDLDPSLRDTAAMVSQEFSLPTLSEKLEADVTGWFAGDPPWGYYSIAIAKEEYPIITYSVRLHDSDNGDYGGDNSHKELANQILSTFRFVDDEQSLVPMSYEDCEMSEDAYIREDGDCVFTTYESGSKEFVECEQEGGYVSTFYVDGPEGGAENTYCKLTIPWAKSAN